MNSNEATTQPERRGLSRRKAIAVCVVLLLAGAAALLLIFSTEPVAERETQVRESAMLVDVISPQAGTFHPVIRAMGTVVPAREITLRPRVGGEIAALSDSFVPGGFVEQGELLVRIDDADYRNALTQRESELQQAIAALEIERGRQDVAERDYRELDRALEPEKKNLVLRKPQQRSAEAQVQSARAAAEQARLELERTEIRAPFDAQVLSREVNLGSQVAAGDPMARLVDVDTYWVETTIPLDRLRWLEFASDDGHGSPVRVLHRAAWPDGQAREGTLLQLVGELEGTTRLARALVSVDDPLALQAEAPDVPRMIIGAFVECLIRGRAIENVLKVPRDHLRKDDTVWLMRDGSLAIRQVDIVFQDSEFAYIGAGLSADDRVITTSLATVQEGIPLRLKGTASMPAERVSAPAAGGNGGSP